jgi:prepilin-type N-terminal cleavage/methylation domain-containing protein
MQQRQNKNKKGFSFIEVMLSVFLLSMGMVAAIILLGKGLRESIDSRNQLIASLLAQEGVELVRNIRDKNWVTPQDSFMNINNGAQKIDIISSALAPISVAAEAVLNYDSTNHRYAHTGGSATKFYRDIVIANGANANERILPA